MHYACWNPHCPSYAAADVTFSARELGAAPDGARPRCPDCGRALTPTHVTPRLGPWFLGLVGALLGAAFGGAEGAILGAGFCFFGGTLID